MKRSDFRLSRHNIVQFLEYMVGGTVYFWSGYVVFALCYSGFAWDWLPSKMAADVIGWTLNYLVQRYWAFNSKDLQKHEKRAATRYILVSIVNLGLDYVIIWGLKSIGVSPYIGFFISAGFFTFWNYFWYRFWVFFSKRKHVSGVAHG
jgi:putative flippase GtrA